MGEFYSRLLSTSRRGCTGKRGRGKGWTERRQVNPRRVSRPLRQCCVSSSCLPGPQASRVGPGRAGGGDAGVSVRQGVWVPEVPKESSFLYNLLIPFLWKMCLHTQNSE